MQVQSGHIAASSSPFMGEDRGGGQTTSHLTIIRLTTDNVYIILTSGYLLRQSLRVFDAPSWIELH